jgi:hypothetical protein
MSNFSKIVPSQARIRDFYAHIGYNRAFKSLELPKNEATVPKNEAEA